MIPLTTAVSIVKKTTRDDLVALLEAESIPTSRDFRSMLLAGKEQLSDADARFACLHFRHVLQLVYHDEPVAAALVRRVLPLFAKTISGADMTGLVDMIDPADMGDELAGPCGQRPCVPYYRTGRCENGLDCVFCHSAWCHHERFFEHAFGCVPCAALFGGEGVCHDGRVCQFCHHGEHRAEFPAPTRTVRAAHLHGEGCTPCRYRWRDGGCRFKRHCRFCHHPDHA